ncbi:hypothetical protein OXX59_004783 [Metschnikowia pulcherrima]
MSTRMRRRITTAKREEIKAEQKIIENTIVRPFETLEGLPISYNEPPNGHYEDILKNPLTIKDSAVLYNSLIRSRNTYVYHAPMFKLHWVKQTAYAKKLAEMDREKQKEMLRDREHKRKFAKATTNSLEARTRMDIRIFIAKDARSDKSKAISELSKVGGERPEMSGSENPSAETKPAQNSQAMSSDTSSQANSQNTSAGKVSNDANHGMQNTSPLDKSDAAGGSGTHNRLETLEGAKSADQRPENKPESTNVARNDPRGDESIRTTPSANDSINKSGRETGVSDDKSVAAAQHQTTPTFSQPGNGAGYRIPGQPNQPFPEEKSQTSRTDEKLDATISVSNTPITSAVTGKPTPPSSTASGKTSSPVISGGKAQIQTNPPANQATTTSGPAASPIGSNNAGIKPAPPTATNSSNKPGEPAGVRPSPTNLQSIDNTIMISNLNAIAKIDLSLNDLMKEVASGKASESQITRFKKYIERAKQMGPQPHHADLYYSRGLSLPPDFPRPYSTRPLIEKKPVAKPKVFNPMKLTAFQERYLHNATLVFEFLENPNVRYIIPQDSICEVLKPELPAPADAEAGVEYNDVLLSHIWIHNVEEMEKYEKDCVEYEREIARQKEEEEKKQSDGASPDSKTEQDPNKPITDTKPEPRALRTKKKAPIQKKKKQLTPPEFPHIKYTTFSFTIHNIPARFIPIFINSMKPLDKVQARMEQILKLGTRVTSFYLWYQVDARLDEVFAEDLRNTAVAEEKKMTGFLPPVEPKKRKPRENKNPRPKRPKEQSPDQNQESPLSAQPQSGHMDDSSMPVTSVLPTGSEPMKSS